MHDYYNEKYYPKILNNSTLVKAGNKWRLISPDCKGFGVNNVSALILRMCDGQHKIIDILRPLMMYNKKEFLTNLVSLTEFLHRLEQKGLVKVSKKPCRTTLTVEVAKVHSKITTCPYYAACKGCEPDSFDNLIIFPYPGCVGEKKLSFIKSNL